MYLICVLARLSICLSFNQFVYPSVCLNVCLAVGLSVCLSMYLSVRLSIFPSAPRFNSTRRIWLWGIRCHYLLWMPCLCSSHPNGKLRSRRRRLPPSAPCDCIPNDARRMRTPAPPSWRGALLAPPRKRWAPELREPREDRAIYWEKMKNTTK